MSVIIKGALPQALTRKDKERAMLVSKDTYPFRTVCAVCGAVWGQHRGALCPANGVGPFDAYQPGESLFLPLLEGDPQFDI